jgi:glycosyltransferase involved in cell wall biosynthesis
MMQRLGHEVVLYAGEDNEVPGVELVTCITKEQQAQFGFKTPDDAINLNYDWSEQIWRVWTFTLLAQLSARVRTHEVICLPYGLEAARMISDQFPNNVTVEHGVGYSGIAFNTHCVFDSYAWRNYVYGMHKMDGRCFDEVIPNYFEVNEFPEPDPQDYYMWCGRLNSRKGLHIAQKVCEKLGKRLLVVGQGTLQGYGEHLGTVGPEERGRLMAGAIALFMPTIYVPPFEKVHVEAMMCGTPAITTDFGAFTETVWNDVNGWRCTMFNDFVLAAEKAADWTMEQRVALRAQTQAVYSMDVVALQYESYFNRLSSLWGDGFYDERYVSS